MVYRARKIRVVTESGTDITFDLEGCKWNMGTGMCHEPGCSSNLPAGELYIAPGDSARESGRGRGEYRRN